jgi:ribonucleoside-diphosphate reductase alpha chain
MTQEMICGCGSIYVTINEDDNKDPYEVFVNISKTGSCTNAITESIGRVISIALQGGAKLDKIFDTLIGIRCPRPTFHTDGRGENVLSCSDAIAKCIKNYLELKKGSVDNK